MRIKRIKKLKVASHEFAVTWNRKTSGAGFNYCTHKLMIGTRYNTEDEIFALIVHELYEMVANELGVRLCRPDCDSDYIFVFDHRQHDNMSCMIAGLLSQFIS